MKKTKKNYIIVALVVVLLAIAIGYSAFSATLKINGTATGTGTWDVHFKTATLGDYSHGTAEVTNSKTVTVNVELAYPGDAVMLTTVIENNGNVAAKLTSITPTGVNEDDLIITQATPSVGEVLAANGGKCTSQFNIQWNPEATTSDLNSKSFTITFEYEQAPTAVNLTPAHSDT